MRVNLDLNELQIVLSTINQSSYRGADIPVLAKLIGKLDTALKKAEKDALPPELKEAIGK